VLQTGLGRKQRRVLLKLGASVLPLVAFALLTCHRLTSAKVIIGDLDLSGAEKTASDLQAIAG